MSNAASQSAAARVASLLAEGWASVVIVPETHPRAGTVSPRHAIEHGGRAAFGVEVREATADEPIRIVCRRVEASPLFV